MRGLTPTKNGAVTGLQSSATTRQPLRVPTAEELPPLIARSPLAIFDEAITFLRIQPGLLLGVTLIILVPLRLIAVAMPGSPLRDARPDQLMDIFIGNLSQPGAVTAALITIILESVALFTVASLYGELVASWYSGRGMTASDVLVASIKRSPTIAAAWLIVHVLEFAGAVFTVGLGGLLIGVFLTVAAPIVGAENAGPIVALRRSVNLVAPKVGHTTAVYCLAGIGAVIMRLVIEFAPSFLGLELLRLPLWLTSGVVDLIAAVVATSFVAATSTVLYLDLRVRREGIDLEMAMSKAFSASPPVQRRSRG